jgi:hypothetical protein
MIICQIHKLKSFMINVKMMIKILLKTIMVIKIQTQIIIKHNKNNNQYSV